MERSEARGAELERYDSYRDLVARLAGRQAALSDEQAAIQTWYAQQHAAARTAVERAQGEVARATARLDAARSTVEHTDIEAHRLWRQLEDRVGALGAPPAAGVTGSTVETDPQPWLDKVADRLEAYLREQPRGGRGT